MARDGLPQMISPLLPCGDDRVQGGMWGRLGRRAGSGAEKFAAGLKDAQRGAEQEAGSLYKVFLGDADSLEWHVPESL